MQKCNWIYVDEQLPPEEERVLVLIGDGIMNLYPEIMHYFNGRWYLNGEDFGEPRDGECEFWQPLPCVSDDVRNTLKWCRV